MKLFKVVLLSFALLVICNATSDIEKKSVPKILSDKQMIDFLDSASFGMTKELKNELNRLGVVNWLEKEFSAPYVPHQHLIKTISLAKEINPKIYPKSIKAYLEENENVFNKGRASKNTKMYQMSAWFDVVLKDKNQLRHRVAYVLSQIVVLSLAESFFVRRTEGVATYMDVLTKNAFGNYRDLLIDVSHSSAMGLFLTYNGSRKEERTTKTVVYPDENYAREIMQLFTIGLYELNLDGTKKLDKHGNSIPSYEQKDVNELAKVFTGWDLKHNKKYGASHLKDGDVTHALEFTKGHHDFREKIILGKKIKAGLSGDEDIEAAVNILMEHPNVAPFISKQFIMRMVKSNPTPAYVERVSKVFNDNGKGVKGDLKAVVRAVLLDSEAWEDEGIDKFKEPLIAYLQFLRAFNVQPLPVWRFASKGKNIFNRFYFRDPTHFLGQGPLRAKTVFNFYDNGFIPPNKVFQEKKWVAPELQIATSTMLISFRNQINRDLIDHEKRDILKRYGTVDKIDVLLKRGYSPSFNSFQNKFLIDCSAEYDLLERMLEKEVDGTFESFKGIRRNTDMSVTEDGKTDRDRALLALIEHLDKKLTGGRLSTEEKDLLFLAYKDNFYDAKMISVEDPQREIYEKIMVRIITEIVSSETYMTR